MLEPVITVDHVSRWFATSGGRVVEALREVCFEVERGASVALLGRNGAGKSTLVKIIATMLTPSAGRVVVAGHDVVHAPRRARRHLGVVIGGDRGLYNLLTARENVRYFGMLAGVRARALRTRVPAVLEQVGLGDSAHRRVEEFSKGMRQRLHIAIALVSQPQILVLDEPTVGLDPLEADRLRQHVASLREQEVTVLLTSHVLLDVERLSDRVIMIDQGRLLHDLSVTQFARTTGYAAVVTVTTANRPSEDALARWRGSGLEESGMDGGGNTVLQLRVARWGPEVMHRLGDLLGDVDVLDVDVRPSSLDEAFALVSGAEAGESAGAVSGVHS